MTKKLDVGTDTIIGRLNFAFSNTGGRQCRCRNTPTRLSVSPIARLLRPPIGRCRFLHFVPYKFSVLNFWRSYEDKWEM
jgi:hypothetical protein